MDERLNEYIIPENFIDEGRCFRGLFKTRNFIEGLIVALILGSPSLLIPFSAIEYKIGFCFVTFGLPFAITYSGFNGDATSVFVKYAHRWFKNKDLMLYDDKLKVLKETPLEYMESKDSVRDNIIDKVENIRSKVIRDTSDEEYIEGETFVFEEDEEIEKLLVEMPDEMRKVQVLKEEDIAENESENGEADDDEIDLTEKLEITL